MLTALLIQIASTKKHFDYILYVIKIKLQVTEKLFCGIHFPLIHTNFPINLIIFFISFQHVGRWMTKGGKSRKYERKKKSTKREGEGKGKQKRKTLRAIVFKKKRKEREKKGEPEDKYQKQITNDNNYF